MTSRGIVGNSAMNMYNRNNTSTKPNGKYKYEKLQSFDSIVGHVRLESNELVGKATNVVSRVFDLYHEH